MGLATDFLQEMTGRGTLPPCKKIPPTLANQCYQLSRQLEKRQRRPVVPCLVATRVVVAPGETNFLNAK